MIAYTGIALKRILSELDRFRRCRKIKSIAQTFGVERFIIHLEVAFLHGARAEIKFER